MRRGRSTIARRAAGAGCLLAALLAACGDGDGGEAETAPAARSGTVDEGIAVELRVAREIGWGDTATVRLRVANRGRDSLRGAALVLEAPPPLVADGTRSGGGEPGPLRVSEPVPTLAPGAAHEAYVRLRLDAPMPAAADTAAADSTDGVFVVRASVRGPGGRSLAGAADTLVGFPTRAALARCARTAALPLTRVGIGALRLGTARADVRALCPGARDTAWASEGTRETGLVVPLGVTEVLATTTRDTVATIVVRDPLVRTAAGLGVGDRLAALRNRYGRGCAAREAEGDRAVVRFDAAPGLSFFLDAAAEDGAPLDSLPADARVEELLAHGGELPCPVPDDDDDANTEREEEE